MKVKVNLLTLGLSIAIWSVIFPKEKNKFLNFLEQIPAFREFKGQFFRNTTVEIFKIAGIYFTLTRLNKGLK